MRPWATPYGIGRWRFPWDYLAPPLTPPRAPHANAARQRIRHGLSRYRPGPSAGVRTRLALRFPHLVGGARAADAKTSGDRGQLAALFSRTLGRRRRYLFDRAACR